MKKLQNKIFLSVIAFLLLFNSVDAQGFCVNKFNSYYNNSSKDEFNDVQIFANEPFYYAAGKTYNGNYLENPMFSKMDMNGGVVWTKVFDGLSVPRTTPPYGVDRYSYTFTSFAQNPLTTGTYKEFFIVGTAEQGASGNRLLDDIIFIVKMDNNGNVLWQEQVLISAPNPLQQKFEKVSNARIRAVVESGVTKCYVDYWCHNGSNAITPAVLKFQNGVTNPVMLDDHLTIFNSPVNNHTSTIINHSSPISQVGIIYAGSIYQNYAGSQKGAGLVYRLNNTTLDVLAGSARKIQLLSSNESLAITDVAFMGNNFYFSGYTYTTAVNSIGDNYYNSTIKKPIIIKTNASYVIQWAYQLNSTFLTNAKGWGIFFDGTDVYMNIINASNNNNYIAKFTYLGAYQWCNYQADNVTPRFKPYRTFKSALDCQNTRWVMNWGKKENKVTASSLDDAYLGVTQSVGANSISFCNYQPIVASISNITVSFTALPSNGDDIANEPNISNNVLDVGELLPYNVTHTKIGCSGGGLPLIPNKGNDMNIVAKTSIFPNPTTGRVTLSIPNESAASTTDIMLFDMQGKQILRETKLINEGNNELEYDLTHLPKGMYVFHIKIGNEVSTQKLIVD